MRAATYHGGGERLRRGLQALSEKRKAPDSLLKLGMSLARADQKQNACVALAKLGHDFPQAGAAVKAARRGREEKAGLLTRPVHASAATSSGRWPPNRCARR